MSEYQYGQQSSGQGTGPQDIQSTQQFGTPGQPSGPSRYGQPPAQLEGHGQQSFAQPYPVNGQPPTYGAPVYIQHQAAPSNGVGTAGFVTGLLGLIFFWIPLLGIILALIGVILGGVGISAGKKNGAGTGLAIAGLVLGLIALIPAVVVIATVSSFS